jgi:hypothetical protein
MIHGPTLSSLCRIQRKPESLPPPIVASLAKCLLGERSLQFFRFRGPRCVGQRDLYPFAILFRELPVDRHEELIRCAMRWPDPLADQIVRVLKR